MDSSDWIGLLYVVIAVGSFPFVVRSCWRDEVERAKKQYFFGDDPELGLAGFYALALCFFWPFVVAYWIAIGVLKLLTIGIEDQNGTD